MCEREIEIEIENEHKLGAHVEVRGQLVRVSSLFLPLVPGI